MYIYVAFVCPECFFVALCGGMSEV